MPDTFREPARADVRRLLAQAGLPTEDLEGADLRHFFGSGVPAHPDGVVGVELLGAEGLLRSLAVDPGARNRGLGRRLVGAAEEHARRQGVRSLYLLTTTAADFFERLGYRRLAREAAPDSIRGTQEFGSLCPASAAFMVKGLSDEGRR